MAWPDGCGAEGGGVGDLGRSPFFPYKRGLDLLRKLQGVQPNSSPSPGVALGLPTHLWPQDCAAPGRDVAGPAGDTQVIQKCFYEFPLALSLHSALWCFCLLLKVDQSHLIM